MFIQDIVNTKCKLYMFLFSHNQNLKRFGIGVSPREFRHCYECETSIIFSKQPNFLEKTLAFTSHAIHS